MCVHILGLRVPFHRDSSVSRLPLYSWIAFLAIWRFLTVVFHGSHGFQFSLIPWYAVACDSEANFAPCRSNSLGISRDRESVFGLFAPSLVRRSLSSFPRVPLWPLTHWKSVVAVRLRSRKAALLNRSAFLMPIQPLSSHVCRCVVRPSIAYLESDIIVRGQKLGKESMAAIMAASSPTWLDWWGPGIRIAAFLVWLGPIQMPLPHWASNFPLLLHVPSVYTVVPWWRWFTLMMWLRRAGKVEILLGSVNILKHSARLCLQVIEGLNRILLLVTRTSRLLFFLAGVSDRLSWLSPGSRGFSFGTMRSIRARASTAQSWGWLHPAVRSFEQSLQMHWGSGVWGKSRPLFRSRADVVIRSATVATEWVPRRHFAVLVVRGRAAAFRWYHAGS